MKKIDRKLLRTFSTHKSQYIALMFLVAIGITIYLTFVMAVYNLDDTIKAYYKEHNSADIYLTISDGLDNIIKGLNEELGIKAIEPRGSYEALLVFDQDTKIRMLSVPNKINKLYLDEGQENIKANEVLILKSFADARKLHIGDTLTLSYRGIEETIKVKGIVSSPEFIYLMEDEKAFIPSPKDYGVIYFSSEFMESFIGVDYPNELLIDTKQDIDNHALVDSIKTQFGEIGVLLASTRDQQLSYRMAEEEINGEIKMAKSLPVLFLFVAIIILSIMISKLVENDRISIGILKAIGYSNRTILMYYTKFTLLIGLTGAFIGIVIGCITSYQFTGIYTKMFQIPVLTYHFDPKYILQAIGISVGFSMISGLVGARKVLKLSPDEAMKPKLISKGKHILIDKFKQYQNLSYTNKMVIRNIFRQKRRFILMTLGVALSCAIIFIPFALSRVMDMMYSDQYSKFQVYDFDLTFEQPMTDSQIIDFEKNVEGANVEPYISIPVDLLFNGKTRTTILIGIEEDSQVFHLLNQEQKTVQFENDAFVLTEGLANSFGIKKGDTITLKTYFGDLKQVDVVVTDLVQQKLGTNGYMLNGDLKEKFLGNIAYYTGAYIQGRIDEDKVVVSPLIKRIVSVDQIMNTYKSFTGLINFSIGMMVVLGGVLGFVIIYIISIQAIHERMNEFSTLRVLGLTQKEVFDIISRENLIASIVGIIVGIPIGKGLLNAIGNYLSNDLYSLKMSSIEPKMIIYTTFWTLIFVLLGQGLTRSKINRMNFLDSLKQRLS